MKTGRTHIKRAIAGALALLLVISMLPTHISVLAAAEEGSNSDGDKVNITVVRDTETETDTVYIGTKLTLKAETSGEGTSTTETGKESKVDTSDEMGDDIWRDVDDGSTVTVWGWSSNNGDVDDKIHTENGDNSVFFDVPETTYEIAVTATYKKVITVRQTMVSSTANEDGTYDVYQRTATTTTT